MKKALLTLLCLGTLATSFAQWKVGIEATGLLARDVYDDSDFEDASKYNFGYSGHLFLERRFSDVFGLSFEPGYLVKGGKIEDEVSGITFTNRVSYISIPVQANLHFLNIFGISIGPEFSTKVGTEFETDPIGAIANNPQDYSNFEVSGLIGFYVSPLPKFKLGLRYSFGLTESGKLDDYNANGQLIKVGSKAQYVQVMARVLFN